MDEETRRKERAQFGRIFGAFANRAAAGGFKQNESGLFVPEEKPQDVGDGWTQNVLPDHPMFKHAKSYSKNCADGGFLTCMVERRTIGMDDPQLFKEGRWHLSISHNRPGNGVVNAPGRMPTWDEIKEARYKFIDKDLNMAIMFPPESMYYSRHATCLHLLEIPVSLALDPRQKGGI